MPQNYRDLKLKDVNLENSLADNTITKYTSHQSEYGISEFLNDPNNTFSHGR